MTNLIQIKDIRFCDFKDKILTRDFWLGVARDENTFWGEVAEIISDRIRKELDSIFDIFTVTIQDDDTNTETRCGLINVFCVNAYYCEIKYELNMNRVLEYFEYCVKHKKSSFFMSTNTLLNCRNLIIEDVEEIVRKEIDLYIKYLYERALSYLDFEELCLLNKDYYIDIETGKMYTRLEVDSNEM